MKKIAILLSMLHLTLVVQAQDVANKVKKSIVVIVDGIPADMIERIETPNIDAISQIGGYTRAYMGGEREGYSETPTISAVCYTSMITGTWGNKHNVWNNDLKDPNYNYKTFFRLMRDVRPESKLAIYSTWLDNRTKLIGEGKVETDNFKFDIHFDGYEYDLTNFPHDNMGQYISKIDEKVVEETSKSIRKDAPDFSWVYLQYTDNAGHMFGDGDGMIDAIKKADRQVGDIFNAVKYREQYHNEDWMVVVITDHGRDVATGYSHGKQSDRERTIWFSTNSKKLNKHFHAHTPAIVDIYPSLARHMDLTIPEATLQELDGVPFVGDVSIADGSAKLNGKNINVEWTPIEFDGEVEILISNSNNFKSKGIDKYVSIGKFSLKDRKASIVMPNNMKKSSIYKILFRGKNNILNRWILNTND
ncbi:MULTISPECIES: alkaline phosphatase family protein [Sphingobacterium]|uniref:alkaline phosphatase family protein n=1 Tax=Sphingobacterium TaxID=28453 RepID=UPI0013D9C8FB|nr:MULTISPECIES: alkaline phosphatase family protein [unclassified Sphingobacterium]